VRIRQTRSYAGGRGNGAQLLALTIGGCFCNDLRYVANAIGEELGTIPISAAVELEGDPILATAATTMVACKILDGSTAHAIIEKANAVCMAINSPGLGIPVQVRTTAWVDLTSPQATGARPFRAAKPIMALHSLRSINLSEIIC
jgi:organic hydroperoxide reductase OsmC/OhrA